MENQKGYYAIIPANVRYCKELPANAKLLYGEITALCNEKGFCWASNNYFSELYGVSEWSITQWIGKLEKNGFIQCTLKENYRREIFLRGVLEKTKGGLRKTQGGVLEKPKDNNTVNNTSNNTVNTSNLSVAESDSFNNFWNLYDKKVGMYKSKIKWNKLSLEEQKAIIDYLPKYILYTPDKKYRKNPETFLNNRSWEDELPIEKTDKETNNYLYINNG